MKNKFMRGFWVAHRTNRNAGEPGVDNGQEARKLSNRYRGQVILMLQINGRGHWTLSQTLSMNYELSLYIYIFP